MLPKKHYQTTEKKLINFFLMLLFQMKIFVSFKMTQQNDQT